MKLLPYCDIWRHPDGWAVTVYQPDGKRTSSLPTTVCKTRFAARMKARDYMLMELVGHADVYGAESHQRVARYTHPEEL